MFFKNYLEVIEDLNYGLEFNEDECRRAFRIAMDDSLYSNIFQGNTFKLIKKIWVEHIKEKYEETKKANTALGKFLQKYPLEFKEFCCLMMLLKQGTGRFSLFSIEEDEDDENPFQKFKIRYESSQLKRWSLVYRIVDPLTPLRTIYEVSYKAQLALKNKPYTKEYEQLDMAKEDEAKRNSPDALDGLYYVINPKNNFDDLIVSDKLKETLKSAIARDNQKDKIFKKWGFKNVVDYGKGTTLNFRGPPGTGKTLAANVIAKELNKKLLMVRYDQLQDKYVGETEKHIQHIFKMASNKNAVLFFDEADAIALNRATLEKSWEMSQVNTLLKELERFEGVCIFASNFYQKYDPAFERRLTMHIDFVLPEKEQCAKILNKLIPLKAREKDISFESFCLEGFSGGDLKNVALNSAGIAAKENAEKISKIHIASAINMTKDSKKTGYNVNYLG